jgi:hypothetical protein
MHILVVGPARSATSWTATTLGETRGASVLLEPDNVRRIPFASKAFVGQGLAPVLGAADPGPPALRRLWDAAYGAPVRYLRGQQRVADAFFARVSLDALWRSVSVVRPVVDPRLRVAHACAVPRHLRLREPSRHRVVKSVRAQLMLEWVLANWSPRVVVCRRHPLDVVASRLEMDVFPIVPDAVMRHVYDVGMRRFGVEQPPADRVLHHAWSVGANMSVLDDAVRAHPEFAVVDHEDLCADPIGRFRALAGALGLDWMADDEARLVAADRPGTGFELNRVAADVPGSWRQRLPPEDARAAAAMLRKFPIAERYDLRVD